MLARLRRDSSGVSMVEYGLLVATLSIAIILGLNSFTNNFINLWLIVDAYTTSATNGG
jgi:Flp pilus assembly pilin Flp